MRRSKSPDHPVCYGLRSSVVLGKAVALGAPAYRRSAPSKALGLRWDQVDWEGHVMRLHATQTKGGDARVFPFGLAPELTQGRLMHDLRTAARDFRRRGVGG